MGFGLRTSGSGFRVERGSAVDDFGAPRENRNPKWVPLLPPSLLPPWVPPIIKALRLLQGGNLGRGSIEGGCQTQSPAHKKDGLHRWLVHDSRSKEFGLQNGFKG